MHQESPDTIESVAHMLRRCGSILFITGAGISADSGMPTYRGIGGLYDVEVTEEGIPIEEILSGTMLRTRPDLTWKYLVQIADAARRATFNRAHEVIVEMEHHFDRVWTLTQNVDGFHRLAGSRNLIEIHGNMRSLSCTKCSYETTVDEKASLPIPPHCPQCESILRPDVVLFGEMLPLSAVSRLETELDTGFEAVFSIGTSSVFPYIQQPVLAARQAGIPTVEINPSETVLSRLVDYRLPLGAAAAMDEIWRLYRDESNS